jgi:ubiquinone/menaquinone biosynthesis C-methylase UbiE
MTHSATNDTATFYTDHWKVIEAERLARYEQMFVWRPEQARLLEPAGIATGQRVLDLGCGPGFLSLALAEMVGRTGAVHGVDINARFVADARARALQRDFSHVQFHHLDGATLPLGDATVDRVIAKNVLEYVPDVDETLNEAVRVLAPGGKLHAIDSDWGFVIVEPWGKETVDRFFAAAAPAFREPHIGRKLPAAFHAAGLRDIDVRIVPIVDRSGALLSVLRNMRSYIRTFATMPDTEVDTLLTTAERGIDDGTYMACLPQFLVTATKA